jgi:hypothetical protein
MIPEDRFTLWFYELFFEKYSPYALQCPFRSSLFKTPSLNPLRKVQLTIFSNTYFSEWALPSKVKSSVISCLTLIQARE